jgi:Secretion system C-terminal sorting domain/PKD domain
LSNTQPFRFDFRDTIESLKKTDMITIRHTLSILAFALSFTLAAQEAVVITGTVTGAPGPVNVLLTLVSDDGITNETLTIATDNNGVFNYTFGFTSWGTATASVMCGGFLSDTQTLTWSGNVLFLDFQLTYCDINPTDCDAYFWCWNDSIAADSLDIDPYQVWIINESTGTDLTYLWDFGDGAISSEIYPTYEYTEVGTYTVCLYITSGDGCTDSYCYTFTVDPDGLFNGGGAMQQGFTLNVVEEIVLGLEENKLVSNLSVYPNPIGDNSVLSIQSLKAFAGTIEVYNMQGQVVSSFNQTVQSGQNQIALNLGNMASGNYLLKLKNENGQAESIMLTK